MPSPAGPRLSRPIRRSGAAVRLEAAPERASRRATTPIRPNGKGYRVSIIHHRPQGRPISSGLDKLLYSVAPGLTPPIARVKVPVSGADGIKKKAALK